MRHGAASPRPICEQMGEHLGERFLESGMASVTDTIEPLALATQRRTLHGRLPLSSLQRLAPLLSEAMEEATTSVDLRDVEYELEFGIDEGGIPHVRGLIQAILPLTCQRCMEPMDLPVSSRVQLGIVTSRSAAQQLPELYDPLLLTDEGVSVATIVEDELILALPQVAMHESNECPKGDAFLQQQGDGQENASAPQRENPFAVLAQLKTPQSEKND